MGASQGAVTRAVLSQLSTRGRAGGRNPISTLCSQTGNDSVEGKRLVETAVRDLERDGKVIVKRDGNMMITQIIHVKPRRNVDRTERSPQQKREDMFAKGVPAYLSDDQCSPVEVRFAPGRGPAAEVPVDPDTPQLVYTVGAPFVDNLNAGLQALREMADADGVGSDTSVRAVLLMLPGVTSSAAERMMEALRGMGVYVTTKTGFQKSSYVLNSDVARVTEEMLAEYRQKGRKSPQATTSTSRDGTAQAIDEECQDTESVVTPEPASHDTVDPLLRLAEIIEELEAENARLEGVVDSQQGSIIELSGRCTQLTEDLAAANEQLAELQGLLETERSRPRQVEGKVADILARHQR